MTHKIRNFYWKLLLEVSSITVHEDKKTCIVHQKIDFYFSTVKVSLPGHQTLGLDQAPNLPANWNPDFMKMNSKHRTTECKFAIECRLSCTSPPHYTALGMKHNKKHCDSRH
jgi:hypothetical protein